MIDYELHAEVYQEIAKLYLAIAAQNARLGYFEAEKTIAEIATNFFEKAVASRKNADKEKPNA